MKKIFALLALSLAAGLVLSACSSKCDIYLPPDGRIKVIEADTYYMDEGGDGVILVESSVLPLKAEASESWVDVVASGKTIYVSVPEYIALESRSAYVRIFNPDTGDEVTVPITQQGGRIDIDRMGVNFSHTGGTEVVLIKTRLSYTIAQTGTWFTYVETADGLELTAPANATDANTGKLTLTVDRGNSTSTIDITVTQDKNPNYVTFIDDLLGIWNVTQSGWVYNGGWQGPNNNDHQLEITKIDNTKVRIVGIIEPGEDAIFGVVDATAKTITIPTQVITPTWFTGLNTFFAPMVDSSFATGFPNNSLVLTITKDGTNHYMTDVLGGFSTYSYFIGASADGSTLAGAGSYFGKEKWVKVETALMP